MEKMDRFALMAILLMVSSCVRAADPSPGCGRAALESGIHTLVERGLARSYRLQLPAGYRNHNPAPLLMIFHGWGGDENEFLDHSSVRRLASERGYILVAPRGLGSGAPDSGNNSWSFSGSSSGLDGDGVNAAVSGDTDAICDAASTPDYRYASCKSGPAPVARNSCAWTHCQADDVGFALALVEAIGNSLCVDSDRVFATGGSNGGMLAWELGQNPRTAPTFRAIAPLIGLPHRGFLGAQGKPGPMPVLVITGTKDRTVPPGVWEDAGYTTTSNDNDRFYYSGATAITRSWAKSNGCELTRAIAFDDGVVETDCRSYCSDHSAWPAVLDCRADMGHSYELAWSWKLIMDFFERSSP